MCCFSQYVTSVSNTRIFARKPSGNSQFLVYQMQYNSPHENAMILPIPVKRPVQTRSFRFINLSHYEKFFDDLGRGFPQKAPPISFGCSKSANNLEKKESLEVFQIGNYVGSFVPTIAEFSQLDERFGLPAATWDQIPEYNDYSFAVFQLSEGSLRPHPMEF